MSEIKEGVNTSSAEFNEGVEAGLNSPEGTRNWEAGNELGHELKDDIDNTEQVSEELLRDASIPLFMRDIGGDKGNDQDEKDESAE